MGLFGDKVKVGIVLERGEVRAGETLGVTVRISEPDKKVRSGRVDLLYRNTYKYEGRDSDGNRTTTTTTADVVVGTANLNTELISKGGEVTGELVVPLGAPGTAKKSVEWQVRVTIDREHGIDAKAEAPLFVRTAGEAFEQLVAAPAVCGPECGFAFDLASRRVVPGATISGTVTAVPLTDFSARGLRLQLRRIRNDHDGLSDQDTVAEVEVSDKLDLRPGENRPFPFSLQVPADAPPSFDAHHNRQHWYVDAILDRRLKHDVVGRLEVVVHTT